MTRKSAFVLALGICSGAAFANVPDLDLGSLGVGSHAFSGTTVGQPNRIDTYSSPHNPQAMWDQDYIYQFTISQPLVIALSSDDPDGTPDNDFFLLNDLTTTVNEYGLNEASPLHDIGVYQNGTFGLFDAGTYYLVVDAWRGLPGEPGTPATGSAGAFSGMLELAPFSTPSAIDLGDLATENTPFTIDSNTTEFDTELGLYDSMGHLLLEDDDGGEGYQSLLDMSNGLPAGQYFVVLGSYNTVFNDFFAVSGGSEGGNYVLNHPGGTTTGTAGIGEYTWFSFNVVPEPGTFALLALAGVAVIRRR